VKLTTINPHADYLDITNTRVSTIYSTDWRSAGYRIQQKVDNTYMAYIQFNGGNDGGISFGTGQTTVSATSILERFKIDNSGNSFFTGNVQVGGNVNVVGNGTFGTGYISLTSIESGEMKLENVGSSVNGILKRLRSSWYGSNFDYNIYRGGSTDITKATFSHNDSTILTLEQGGIRVLNYAYIGTNLSVGSNLTLSNLSGTGTRSIAVDSSGKIITADTNTWDAGHSFPNLVQLPQYRTGYQKMSNGLIFQWAYLTAGSTTYNFPIAFTSLCFSIQITTNRGNSGASGYNHANNVTTTSYYAVIDAANGWMFAVGV
jgi:hypothetical protein